MSTCKTWATFCHANSNSTYLCHNFHLNTAQVKAQIQQQFSSENKIKFSSPSEQQKKSSALQRQEELKISLGKESMATAVGACICGGT